MATVKVKGLEQLRSRLSAKGNVRLNKVFSNKIIIKKLGDIIVNDIKLNVDFGQAANSTKKVREYLERFNTTDSQYERNKIKALFTGALLEDLRANIKGDPTEFSFEVANSKKRHPGYKTANGRNRKAPTFEKLSGYLVDMGYDYFRISDKAVSEITALLRKEILRAFGAS